MIKQEKLEDLIREKVSLGVADSRGFYSLKGQCCHDYKVRAGFKFDNGTVGYNCWNCSTVGLFVELSGEISKKMRRILNAYGIEDSEISAVVNTAFFKKKEDEPASISLTKLTKVNTSTPKIKLPPKTFQLGHPEFLDYQEKLVRYLVDRKVDIDRYPFYFSLEQRFKDRVIIPFYRNRELIYWQARSINDGEKKRYDNAVESREAVLFNYDQLHAYTQLPLFVSEGVFDAMMFNGIAILGSKLTPAKIEILSRSNRRLIFVIDKDKNGQHLAEDVLSHGWEIAFAPSGADDINRSVIRFGHAWTANQLINSVPRGADAARLAINLNCK